MRERSKFINNQMITRNHNLDKYTALQSELRRLDLPLKSTLAEWTGQSRYYIGKVFAGAKSFAPRDMDRMLAQLGKDRSEAGRLFPPFGETAEIKEAETLKRIKKILKEAM